MENKNSEARGFSYTYSAKDQAEVRRIREKYVAPTEDEDKMARLRKLDRSVAETAAVISLVLGVIGTLILGFGMSLVLTELGVLMRIGMVSAWLIGILAGVLGSVLVALAYPTYRFVEKKQRQKVASEVLRLTDELLQK